MKNKFPDYTSPISVICFTILIFTASCNKRNQSASESENICVTRLSPKVGDYAVSGAGLDSIYALFNANNLSTANLQFQSWGTDTEVNVDQGAYNGYQEQVLATQFFNGLPVFADEESFAFNDGKFQPVGIYDGYNGPVPNADTIGHQGAARLLPAYNSYSSNRQSIILV